MHRSIQSWRIRTIIKRLLFLAFAVLLIRVYWSDKVLFSWPAEQEARYAAKLGRALEKRGLHAVLTFDDPVICESVRRGPCGSEMTRCVPGRFGNARSFRDADSGMIWTDVKWRNLDAAYTVSMWVRIPPGYPDQAIMWWTGGDQKTGLMLAGGRLTFAVPGQGDSVLVSYPFENYDRWVFIAASVDRDAGFVRLYENGGLKAEGAVSVIKHPPRYVVFGKMNSLKIGLPFRGDIDETAFWSRALPAEEISNLFRMKESLVADKGDLYAWKYRTSALFNGFMRSLPGYVQLFNPFVHNSRLDDMGLPVCDIFLSGEDQRWLNTRHGWYLRNRTLTDDARRSRRVKLALNGDTVDASMALCYPVAMTSSYHRMSYVVELDPGVEWRGMNSFALLAPEDYGMLMPLAESAIAHKTGLAADSDEIAVLRINGSIRGAFYCVEYSGSAFERIHENVGAENLVKSLPPDTEGWLGIYDALVERYGSALANDTASGVSAREWRCRLRCARDILREWTGHSPSAAGAAAGPVAEMLNPHVIRGGNVSLLCITTNLLLDGIKVPGIALKWSSTRPDLIDEAGRISRPSGSDPVAVELRLDIQADGFQTGRVYQLAVQPEICQIPVVNIKAPEFPNNMYRIPCVAEISGGSIGMPPRRGEIKMRGNTAILYPKKSFSVAMDRPHAVFGKTESRHLYLVGCGEDPAWVRSKLAYELFRDMTPPDLPRPAPHVEMVELFLNGDYLGIYQLMQRIDRHMLGWPGFNEADERHNVLYKSDGPRANFLTPQQEHYQQKEPDEALQPYWEPYRDLITFIGQSSPDEFRARIGEVMDLDNVVDFHLFLLLSNNPDGNNHNLYLARTAEPDSRFFIVPWDYDIAFRGGGFLSNGLFDRLGSDVPEYNGMLKKRWNELRQGVFSESTILARVDALHNSIEPAIVREQIRGVEGADAAADAVEELKAWIISRLSEVDRYLAGQH